MYYSENVKRDNEHAFLADEQFDTTTTQEAPGEFDPMTFDVPFETMELPVEDSPRTEADAQQVKATLDAINQQFAALEPEQPAVANERDHGIISKEAFDRAFLQTHELEFEGDNLEYAKIEPQGEALKSDDWVVFVGGFNTAKESYYSELLNLARSGRKVLFINPETNVELENMQDDGITADIPKVIRTEALALQSVLAHEGISGADFVAHSRGGAVASTLIAANPGIAKRVLLDSPAGLTGKESALKLLGRSLAEFGSETMAKIGNPETESERTEHDEIPPFHDNFQKRLAHRFGWKVGKEMPAIAKTDIRPLLEHIKNTNIGTEDRKAVVEIILLNANSDHIFTPEKIGKALGDDPFRYLDRWANYVEKEAVHGKISRPIAGAIPDILQTSDNGAVLRPSMIAHILSEQSEANEGVS